MKILELFSGTHSVGKVATELGWEVVSLDFKDATINTDILLWDYKIYKPKHFDVIWSSFPCDTFSRLRNTWIGRKLKCHNGEICTHELLQKDIDEKGLPILRKSEEIINYLKPTYYFMENPQTGLAKNYITRPFYDVDYCKYSDWGYQKKTRIWTNLKGFIPKICKKDCDNLVDFGNRKIVHRISMGASKTIKTEEGDIIKLKTPELRIKYKDYENIIPYLKGGCSNRDERYRIPPNLINELFALV